MAVYYIDVEGMKVAIVEELYYTESDEWVRVVEDDIVIVGVTDYAQKMLKDVVGVELPEVGASFNKGDPVAVIESIKASADVYSPVEGEIIEVNERLLEEPELINKDPYGDGWIFKMKIKNGLEGLLTHKEYVDKLLSKS
ncbi:MAG: glycine cleavage system protein GcvH [Desulfurococcales archaeon]|nr:glycine cleavage system protein GcvH [Desulfurococcales archaeon]